MQALEKRIAALEHANRPADELTGGMPPAAWEGNTALLSNADGASSAIIRAFWLALRGDLPKVH